MSGDLSNWDYGSSDNITGGVSDSGSTLTGKNYSDIPLLQAIMEEQARLDAQRKAIQALSQASMNNMGPASQQQPRDQPLGQNQQEPIGLNGQPTSNNPNRKPGAPNFPGQLPQLYPIGEANSRAIPMPPALGNNFPNVGSLGDFIAALKKSGASAETITNAVDLATGGTSRKQRDEEAKLRLAHELNAPQRQQQLDINAAKQKEIATYYKNQQQFHNQQLMQNEEQHNQDVINKIYRDMSNFTDTASRQGATAQLAQLLKRQKELQDKRVENIQNPATYGGQMGSENQPQGQTLPQSSQGQKPSISGIAGITKKGRPLDRATAAIILKSANGDKQKAAQMAINMGFDISGSGAK